MESSADIKLDMAVLLLAEHCRNGNKCGFYELCEHDRCPLDITYCHTVTKEDWKQYFDKQYDAYKVCGQF